MQTALSTATKATIERDLRCARATLAQRHQTLRFLNASAELWAAPPLWTWFVANPRPAASVPRVS